MSNEKFKILFSISFQLVFIVFIICFFIFRPEFVIVSGNSMNPTYQDTDIVFAVEQKEVERFDVIVFWRSDNNEVAHQYLIKRVIGLPGETVEITNNGIIINGVLLEETFDTVPYSNVEYKKFALKEDEYFVLGDNRPNSYDSQEFGPINKRQIVNIVITDIIKH